DGVVVDHDRAGRHQAGTVDVDPVADVDPGFGAEGEQRGSARLIPDPDIAAKADPAASPDAQPPRPPKAGAEGMAGGKAAAVHGAHGYAAGGAARERILNLSNFRLKPPQNFVSTNFTHRAR